MCRPAEEWLDDRHAEARAFLQTVRQPGYDHPLRQAGPPDAFTEHPGRLGPAPRLGEHNLDVYGALGLSPEELTILREIGAI